MASAPVSGGPVAGRVMVVGQAPGAREPVLGRPFAWTAGRTLFRWFERATGWGEAEVRDRFYFAAVCRCFPGKTQAGGDRVPAPDEIARCARWLDAELQLLRPALVVPVGKLAIGQFLEPRPLVEVIGRTFPGERAGVAFELLPLPHPSGASPWHRIEPGKSLLDGALALLADRVARAG
jgi:uracil-DNA glycosylase